MFIDVHAHLDDEKFESPEIVIKEAKEMLVNKIITSGADILSSKNAVKIAENNDRVFASIGVHPESEDIFCDFLSSLSNLSNRFTA